MSKLLFEEIKKIRKKKKMTQADLANQSGVNISTIKQIESGRTTTSVENLLEIARVLDVELDEIYMQDYRNTKVVTVCSNKGGVGKSTTVANLGYALSKLGQKILLIDTDMQMNLTRTMGFVQDFNNSIYTAIIKEDDVKPYIKNTEHKNIDIIISDYEMATSEMLLFTKEIRETVLKRMLRNTIDEGIYDYIILDTNSHLGIVNLNCMSVSDFGVVPVELSKYGIDGLNTLTNFIKRSVEKVNPEFSVKAVVPCRVDTREGITSQSQELLEALFGDVITRTKIPTDTTVKKSQWDDQPLYVFDKTSRASLAYEELAKEVISIG